MKLTHNGAEWHGTFVATATAMMTDLLADGPLPVTLTLADDGIEIKVTAERITGRTITATNQASGDTFDYDIDSELLGIEVD